MNKLPDSDQLSQDQNKALHNMIGSLIGSSIAEVITVPVTTVKTVFQTEIQTQINNKFKTSRDVARHIYKTRGVHGFYNSSFMSINSQIISTTSKYTFYNMIKKYRGIEQGDFKNNVINGCFAGVFSTLFTHPFDVAKIHQQRYVDNINFYKALQNEGMPLLTRGFSKSLLKAVPLTGLLFPIYDFYNYYLPNYPNYAALCTSLTVTTVIQPIDYIKVRSLSNLPWFQGFNPLNYYKGFAINLARSTPSFMIAMGITELVKKKLSRVVE
jgi:hypothetical protein